MVGHPLSSDEQTYRCTRLEYAWLHVEIDVSLPFIHKFEIDSPLSSESITTEVQYKWNLQDMKNVNFLATPTRHAIADT